MRLFLALGLSCLAGCAAGVDADVDGPAAATQVPHSAEAVREPSADLLLDPVAVLTSDYEPPQCFTYLSCSCEDEGNPKAKGMPAYCAWYDAQAVCEHFFSCDPR
jgi:hypothetical protein